MRIFRREIGASQPPYYVAEIGANHDGELERALRLIELAADSGADAVKFQHFQAETIVSRKGFAELPKMAHQASWEKDVYEIYEAASIPLDWTEHLASYAHDHGLAFITTPYSIELVDVVEPYVDAYKIGSGDVTWWDLITHIARKRSPILLATGASNFYEIHAAQQAIWQGNSNAEVCMMQCTTDYTGGIPWDTLNLSILHHWDSLLVYDLGFSDHTPGHLAVVAAIQHGARVIEKHFTDDKTRIGPDHSFALDPVEWVQMQEAGDIAFRMIGDGVKRVERNEVEARVVQRRAWRYREDMPFGAMVLSRDLVATRPCPPDGIPPSERLSSPRRLTRAVLADDLVRRGDLEGGWE